MDNQPQEPDPGVSRASYSPTASSARSEAEQGDPSAQFLLAHSYHFGDGVPQDDVQAANWCRRAAEQGQTEAQYLLAGLYQEGDGVPQSSADAADWYRRAADQGHGFAQNNLACMYRDADGVSQDYVQAYKWFTLAASRLSEPEREETIKLREFVESLMTSPQVVVASRLVSEWNLRHFRETSSFDPFARLCLEDLPKFGPELPQNPDESRDWYRRRAEAGDQRAQYSLGTMYSYGIGVSRDHVEAARWYRLAASEGHVQAQVQLAEMYEHGDGVDRDRDLAVEWYRRAAEKGSADGQFHLASMCYESAVEMSDYARSAQWYRCAAEQGHARAQVNLGMMHRYGTGVTRDYAAALAWFARAAEQKDCLAQYALGDMHYEGRAVPVNREKALEWYRRSVSRREWHDETGDDVRICLPNALDTDPIPSTATEALQYLRGVGPTLNYWPHRVGPSDPYFSTMSGMLHAISERDYLRAGHLAKENIEYVPLFVETVLREKGFLDFSSIPAMEKGGTILALLGDDDGLLRMQEVAESIPALAARLSDIREHCRNRRLFAEILTAIGDHPNCLQTQVKLLVRESDGHLVARLIAWLEKARRIVRVREGRTYRLTLSANHLF